MNAFDYFFSSTKNLKKDFLLGENESITFQNLYLNCLMISDQLEKKIGIGEKVIILSDNSLFFLLSYLSIIKSGNVCVPLDPKIEIDRLELIRDQLGCKTFFVQSKLKGDYSFQEKDVIFDESTLNEWKTKHFAIGERQPDSFDSSALMEILYTSGSTGQPKGVMLTHENIIANTDSIKQYLKLSSQDVSCLVLPFFYCYGLSVLHSHLKVGGSVVINNTFVFLNTVYKDIEKYSCTNFSGVPSHFQVLLNKSKDLGRTPFSKLRFVTQAGGKLHDIFIKDFSKILPNVNFYVMYGQTEATARLAFLEPDKLSDKMGSIGKAIPGVCIRIVDNHGKEVVSGQEGELIAKGKNIMRGYYHDKRESKDALKNGWLHTGDIGYKDNEGYIFLVGRSKEIIKVRGKRVSPKEIEEVVLELDGVVNCKVEGIEDDIMGEGIKIVVLPDKGRSYKNLKEEIISHCKSKLLPYKVPQRIEFVNGFRYNSSGKII